MPSKDINISGEQAGEKSSGAEAPSAKQGKGDARKARLSQALRDNLKRRKAQSRARRTEGSALEGEAPQSAPRK